MKKSHDNHLGERNTLERPRKLGIWLEVNKEIINDVKKCPICQLEKTTRVRNRMGSVIPDIQTKPHEKIALDIFGPLSETHKGSKYILSIQDKFTRYMVLIPMINEASSTIVEKLLDHYIYIFDAPNTILTDQGQNFLSELIQQFEEALKNKRIKTTALHPQSNGKIERMHSTLLNLINTSMEENKNDWDKNLKLINVAINTIKNQTTGFLLAN